MISLPSTENTWKTVDNCKTLAYVPDAYSKGFYELCGLNNLEVTHKIKNRLNVYQVSFTAHSYNIIADLPNAEPSLTFKEIKSRLDDISKKLNETTSVKDLEKLKGLWSTEYSRLIKLKSKLTEELDSIMLTHIPDLIKSIDAKINRKIL